MTPAVALMAVSTRLIERSPPFVFVGSSRYLPTERGQVPLYLLLLVGNHRGLSPVRSTARREGQDHRANTTAMAVRRHSFASSGPAPGGPSVLGLPDE